MSSILVKDRLIERRTNLGITKQEAAKRMQMSQPAYLRYESGERMPSIHIIQTMAFVLETSVEYLTGESNSPIPTSYLIRSDEDSELFKLVAEYKSASEDDKKRLLEYYKLLSSSVS